MYQITSNATTTVLYGILLGGTHPKEIGNLPREAVGSACRSNSCNSVIVV